MIFRRGPETSHYDRGTLSRKGKVVRAFCKSSFLLLPALVTGAASADVSQVFFVHGANVDAESAHQWGSVIAKGLYLNGAKMEFHVIDWESDIGQSWNYHANVSNAFVSASRLANYVSGFPGRKVVIAHSLGTVVAASAIQDHGMSVDKFIMLNSAIPSEAFDPSLADYSPSNHLVHEAWRGYTSRCWTARWHELFADDPNDARGKLTWKGRFAQVLPVAVNFYSSGDEVLELYTDAQNPSWYDGVSPSGNWGDRFSWHKQEIWKGRKSLLGLIGTTDWSGWGFKTGLLGLMAEWSADEANAVTDFGVFRTNTVFNPHPESIANPANSRAIIDTHLAQGIPALSPPTGRTRFNDWIMPSFDMNDMQYKVNGWPRGQEYGDLSFRFLHSDIKNVAFFFVHQVFRKIVEVGGLR